MKLVSIALALLVTGCATFKNTPQQDYVWAMWDICKVSGRFNAGIAYIDRVEADGRAWSGGTSGPAEIERPPMWACMHEQYKLHPYQQWLKTRTGQ
jgi:hypothetical protein